MNLLKENGTRIYRIWHNMVSRCHNYKDKQYIDYGAKNIFVCDEWKNDFKAFAWWAMMNGYSNELTIDRINNLKGYNYLNCRWVTPKQQANNRTNNILISWHGETKTLMQWSELTGIHRLTLQQRIFKLKWPIDIAMTKKIQKHNINCAEPH